MTTNNIEAEKKALREIIEQIEDPGETLRKQTKLQRIVFGLGYTGLLLGFIVAWHETVSPVVSSLMIALSGAAIGMGVFLKWSGGMWPTTAKYVDLERVKQRLEQLQTNKTSGHPS